jgi:hypothetical protein
VVAHEGKEGRVAKRREERMAEGLWPKEHIRGKRHGSFLFAGLGFSKKINYK